MKKRIFSFLLCLLLLSALVPASARGEGPNTVQARDIVYFGDYDEIPVTWVVLDPANTNVGTKGMFLLSEFVLDNGKVVFNDNGKKYWQESTAQAWCKTFAENAFSEQELALIPRVSKTEDPIQLFNLSWGDTELVEEQVFFLSVQEIADYFNPEDNYAGLSTTALSAGAPYWWLRTPHAMHDDYAGIVYDASMVHDQMVYSAMGARPVINLMTENVLLLEPASDVKNVGSVGPIEANDERTWKVVIQDTGRSLSLGTSVLDGTVLSVDYSDAATGQNEYISLMVCDAQGKAVQYGKLARANESSGTVNVDLSTLTVPEGGGIYLFSEQDNGAKHSNYAGELHQVGVPLNFAAGAGSGSMEPIMVTPGSYAVLPESGFTPPEYQSFDHWELNGTPLDGQVLVQGETTVTAVYSKIPVTGLSFIRSNYSLIPSDRVEIKASFEPDGAMDMNLEWESSNDQVVSVLNNRDGSCTITARRGGVAVITATSPEYGVSSSVTVDVVEQNESHVLPLLIGLGALALLLILGVIILLVRRRR